MTEVLDKVRTLNIDKSDWETVRFGDVVDEPRETIKDFDGNEVEYVIGLEHIESEDIHIRNFDTTEESTSFTRLFRTGDVLFGRRRAYLKKAAQAPFTGICSGDIIVMRAKEQLMPELLPFIVNNAKFFDYAVKHSAGGLSPRVKFKDLAKYEFKLPPKDQQAQLAELLWAMDEMIEKTNEVLNKNQILFETTLTEVYSGVNGEEKELKDVSNIIMGQSPPGSTYNENGRGEPFIQGNAEFGKRYPKHTKFTTSPKKFAPKGSILMSVRAPVGDLNFADKKYCIGRGLAAIEVSNQDLLHYVFNFLKFSKGNLERNSTGSTFKSINKKILKSLPIKMPSNKEIEKNVALLTGIEKNLKKINQHLHTSKHLSNNLINQIF